MLNQSSGSAPNSFKKSPLLPAGSILSMWAEAADLLLESDQGDAALLYFHILRKNNPFPPRWDLPRVTHAQRLLDGMGLLPPEFRGDLQLPSHSAKFESREAPDYSTSDLTLCLEEDGNPFRDMVDLVQNQLGKALNSNDLKILMTMQDHLGFPTELILTVVTWVTMEHERKFGAGKRPTLTQIRKEAYNWHNKGILTLEAAEEHVYTLQKASDLEQVIIRAFQMKARDFTVNERLDLAEWSSWELQEEIFSLAYEKTVEQITNFKWNYCKKILQNWHLQGATTAEAVAALDGKFANRPRQAQTVRVSKGPSAFDTVQGSASSAPSSAHSQRVAEDLDQVRVLMEQLGQTQGTTKEEIAHGI